MGGQPYVIFRHDDTDKVHYHIVSTKVKEDGKSILWNGIGKRLVHSLAKYQDKYGYVASQALHKQKQEESLQSGITGELNDKIDALIDAKNIYSVEMARKVLEGNGVEMTEFISKNTGRPMIKLRRTGSRPVYIPSDKTERLQKTIAENLRKIAEQPETFVIHGGRDATLYYNRPSPWPKNMEKLHEAARSILKYHTWGAAVRQNKTEEFVERAVKGQLFGTVKFNVEKARFIGESRSDGMLANPNEVIQFICYDGQPVDLFTPEFWTDWHLRLESLKRRIQSQLERKAKEQSVKKAPVPPQKQEEATSPSYEVVKKFSYNNYPYRIKKEQDGQMKLQMLDWDKRSPVVDGKYTSKCWYTKEKFTSCEEVGHDADGRYFKIKDTVGKTRHINQDGIELTAKKLRHLGVGGKGITR